jgi:hypothetical protein
MTKDQARPGREPHRRWRRLRSARARHEPDTPAAVPADQAPVTATDSSRPQLASLFEPDQPDPPLPIAAATPAVAGPPRLVRPPRPPRRTVSAWLLLAPALTLTNHPAGSVPRHQAGGSPLRFPGLPGNRQAGRPPDRPADPQPTQSCRKAAGRLHRGRPAMPQGRIPNPMSSADRTGPRHLCKDQALVPDERPAAAGQDLLKQLAAPCRSPRSARVAPRLLICGPRLVARWCYS